MTNSTEIQVSNQSPTTIETQKLKQTFIEKLKEDYLKALSSYDNEVKTLVQSGQEAKAILLGSNEIGKILEIHETLTTFYNLFFNGVPMLKRFGSERFKQLGTELQPLREQLKDSGAMPEEIEQHVLKNLRSIGIRKNHWLIKEVLLAETEYMLDTLQILIEPEFLPLLEPIRASDDAENKPDRYIPPDVKLSVWRRDQGKCVQCGSKEKLEYDHIIPITKGGSNTERNVQLLCEKCNREKAAKIA